MGMKNKQESCGRKENSAPLLLSGGFLKQRGHWKKRQRRLWSTHSAPSTYIPVQASLQRSAALRGPGLLNLGLAPPSAMMSVWGRREGERSAVLRNWVHTILLRHLQLSRQIRWTAYPGSCKWCCTEAHFDPTQLGGRAMRSLHPSCKSFLFWGVGACTTLNQSKQVIIK